jgi:uncharacterized protein involved in exopolysaccharide biosynthesis
MSLVDLLRVLYSRKLILFGIIISLVGGGMIVTLLLPPTYESTMKILVARDRIDPQVTPNEKNGDVLRSEFTEEEFNSELEILQSRAVIEGVVKQLGLDRREGDAPKGRISRLINDLNDLYRSFHNQTAPDATEQAVDRLKDRLEVVSIKKSRIIKITYRDRDPERAARTIDELYRQYAEHHLRLRQHPKAANVFHEQSEAFGQRLDEATEALKRFDGRNGAAASEVQRGHLSSQYYQVQGELDRARTEIKETEQRIKVLKAQLATQPERIEAESRTKYVEARDKMKDEILSLELQRTQLLQKYLPGHRLVKDVEQRLSQAREMLAKEEQSPPEERTTVLNEVHRRLSNELLSSQANLTALGEREQVLAKLAAQYKRQITKSDTRSLERADLERTRAINEEAYLLYRKKSQEADIVSALNEQRIVNSSLVEAPSVNRMPVSPKPLINLLVFAVIGLIAAVAAIVFIERKSLFSSEAAPLAAYHSGLPSMPEGARLALPHQVPLLTSGDQPQRDGRQYPAGGEGSLSLSGQTRSDLHHTKLTDSANSLESAPADDNRKMWRQRITKAFPKESDSQEKQHRMHPSVKKQVNSKPEAWQVKAVADYLYRAHGVSPDKLSEVFRAAGWEISPAEINEILSRYALQEPYLNGQPLSKEASATTSHAEKTSSVSERI